MTPPDRGARPKRSRGNTAYGYTDDLWILTSYFNPHRYDTKRRNYQRFLDKIERAQLNWMVVECAFGNTPFELRRSPRVLQIRASDVMWQKERLLNIAIQRLPHDCEKVAWVDCDIIFENADWAIQTSELLDQVPVVQPFDKAVRLPVGRSRHNESDKFFAGFCALQSDRKDLNNGRATPRQPSALQIVYCCLCGCRIAAPALLCTCCRDRRQPAATADAAISTPQERPVPTGEFERHGHTGFAWAARKELLLRHGLYDVCLSGTGDHLMAHAICGEWESPCIPRLVGENGPHLEYFLAWGERVYRATRGSVAYVEGTVSHLWHGDDENRNYVDRGWELARLGFDPMKDLRLGDNGCWAWNSEKPHLHQWAIDYFDLRKEDGYAPAESPSSPAERSLAPQGSLLAAHGSRGKRRTVESLQLEPETP
jgi:hypothetical protein